MKNDSSSKTKIKVTKSQDIAALGTKPKSTRKPVVHVHDVTGGMLRLPGVLALFPVSKSTWWAGVKEGKFPCPIRIGPRCTAWRRSDIEAFLRNLSNAE